MSRPAAQGSATRQSSSSTRDTVTVIIPTLAQFGREDALKRAIASVLAQDVGAVPLVVLNGTHNDPRIVAALESDPNVRVVRATNADLPGALRIGRSHVDTPLFTVLHDQDVLLSSALRMRMTALTRRSDCAAVVTNGWRREEGGDLLHVSSFNEIRRDPLRSLLSFNWLLPGAWLGRTHAFQGEVFDRMPRHLECTYLAIRFATTHRTCFIDMPTVAWSVDPMGSTSRLRETAVGVAQALQRILELDLPEDIHRAFRQRLADAQYTVARLYLQEGDAGHACVSYLRSMLADLRLLRYRTRTAAPVADSDPRSYAGHTRTFGAKPAARGS